MYFFYVDESGTLDPAISGQRADGSTFVKDHLYVLAAVSLFESRWHGFEKTLNRKKWELLLEMIERFLRMEHPKHQGVLITDDVSKQQNRSLAMKHAYIQSQGTSAGTWLTHIAEMPLFVRSELSNGVQLADLLAYNIYRCFRDENVDYPFFARIAPYFWDTLRTPADRVDGLWVFPADSPLRALKDAIAKKRAGQ